MAENLNLPLINILTSVDADVLRQIFTDISRKVNEMNDELKTLKQGLKHYEHDKLLWRLWVG